MDESGRAPCCCAPEELVAPSCELSCVNATITSYLAQESFQFQIRLSPPLVDYLPTLKKRPRPRSLSPARQDREWVLPKPPPIAARNLNLPPPL